MTDCKFELTAETRPSNPSLRRIRYLREVEGYTEAQVEEYGEYLKLCKSMLSKKNKS